MVKIENLRVIRNKIPVLDNINLEMETGSFLVLIGPNGGGKTTLVKVLLGLIPPSEGRVRVFNRSPARVNREMPGSIGYLSQDQSFDNRFPLSAFDLVLMGSYRRVGPGRRAGGPERERAREALRLVGMEALADRPIGELSGGQRQRVLIARTLITRPRLVLLDEPTTGVDLTSQDDFYRLLKKLQQQLNLSVILVSHDISFVTRYGDQVACLNRRLYLHGKPREVLTADKLQAAYGCEVDLFFHGKMPHRVVSEHPDD